MFLESHLRIVLLFDNVFIGVLQFRIGNDTLLFIFESANSAMVTDPVLGVFAEHWNCNLVFTVDSRTAVFGQAFHLFELFGADKDFLLRYFYNGAVEVLKEESALL